MTIELTKQELLEILSKQLACNVTDFTIVINARELVNKLRATVEKFRYTKDEKITAIKALREVSKEIRPNWTMGLADAKWAVENWNRFLLYITSHDGRLPEDGFGNRDWNNQPI